MPPVNTIVFDLWYTLVCPEDFRGSRSSSREQITKLLRFDAQDFVSYWTTCQPALYNSHQAPLPLIEAYAAGIGRCLSPEETEEVDRIWEAHDQALLCPRPSILRALDDLRSGGFRLGLLSNAHEREMREWPNSPLASRFDAACFSYAIGVGKPEVAAYARLLDQLGTPADQALFIGDGGSQELIGARLAGLAGCIHMRGFLEEQRIALSAIDVLSAQADAAITDLSDLLTVLGLGVPPPFNSATSRAEVEQQGQEGEAQGQKDHDRHQESRPGPVPCR